MKLQHYLIFATLCISSIFGTTLLSGCSSTEKLVPYTESDLRTSILGEWLPLDTIQGEVYLNHYNPHILTDNEGLYFANSRKINSPDKCIKEEYNIADQSCTLYFVYSPERKIADYCYEVKLIDANTLEWYNYGVNSEGEKLDYRPHNSYKTVRKGSDKKYASYNNELPKDVQNKTWVEIDNYRGDFYYSENQGYLQLLVTYVDSFATRDEYNNSFIAQSIIHCRTTKDTVFIYGEYDTTPSYRLIWLDKKKGVLLFRHPWEDMNNTNKILLIDSTKYTKELLPSKEQLLEQDLERVAFFKKWKEKGYTEKEIESFSWYRPSSNIRDIWCYEEEDSYYDDRSDTPLLDLSSDYDGDGLEDNFSLVEDWLYEKDINHDHLDYTLKISKKLDEGVHIMEARIKVTRPMLEDFTIATPSNGVLELKYDVYAKRDYDTWEYREKTLADVDSVNSYTYTYVYNVEIKDWDLTKIDVIIKTPSGTKQKTASPTGRTLYTLKEEMNPLDDIE